MAGGSKTTLYKDERAGSCLLAAPLAYCPQYPYLQPNTNETMRHKQIIPPHRVYGGDNGPAEHASLTETEWAFLSPIRVAVRRPRNEDRNTRTAYVRLRCRRRVRRSHGFYRYNRHITSSDHYRGYIYCIQCRPAQESILATAVNSKEAPELRQNHRQVMGRPFPPEPHRENASRPRCVREAARGAPQVCNCRCNCDGCWCLGPRPRALA